MCLYFFFSFVFFFVYFVVLFFFNDTATTEIYTLSLLDALPIPIVREHGTPYLWTLLCGNVGLAALMTGDAGRASGAFREELRLCRDLVILPLASEGLRGLAALAALRRDDDRAARLAGAAAAHRYAEPEDAVE